MKIKDKMIKFCCPAFEGRIHNAGKSGISFVAKPENGNKFQMQSRGVDIGLESIAADASFAINLVSELSLKFCPFCGYEVKKWIEGHVEEFEILSKYHEELIISW